LGYGAASLPGATGGNRTRFGQDLNWLMARDFRH